MDHGPHKFDPARAGKLDDPARQRFLPNRRVLEMLDLSDKETVVDYGAGSCVLTVEVARRLAPGEVYAVEESPQMVELLRRRLGEADIGNVRVLPIRVNLLHEVVGETALAEMRRLLSAEGFVLIVDWRADVEREEGPPAEVTFDPASARLMLEEAGFRVEPAASGEFPYHFAFLASRQS